MNVRALILLIAVILTACAPQQPRADVIPTVMALPTVTPTDVPTRTPRPTLTFTLLPSETPIPPTETPDLVQTQFAALDATNNAAQSTLAALQTQLAASPAPTADTPPSAEPLATAAPSPTTDPVVPMPLTTLYARDVTPLRTCADRTCDALQLLSPGMALVVNGSLSGDMIENGNNLWYRADVAGQRVYAYSGYLMTTAPTPIRIFQPPEVTPPVQSFPPVQNVCPRNCTEAVAWGYSAQQAAACGLDRDGDGVACYGD